MSGDPDPVVRYLARIALAAAVVAYGLLGVAAAVAALSVVLIVLFG